MSVHVQLREVLTFALISKLEVGSEDQPQFQPFPVQNDTEPDHQQQRPNGILNQRWPFYCKQVQSLHITSHI